MSQRLNLIRFRKAWRGKPRSERYSGNPTVADRRGACGNVDVIRHCAHRSSIPTRDDTGGIRKRGLWSRLNGHVPRKRRNCQATTYGCAHRISIPTIERCGKRNASNSGAESWTGIGVVTGFGAVVLIVQWPHLQHGDVRWRIRLLQTPQELSLIDKTRNQLIVRPPML